MKNKFLILILVLMVISLNSCKSKNNGSANPQDKQGQTGQEVTATNSPDNAVNTVTPAPAAAEAFKEVDLSAGGWDFKLQNQMRGASMDNISTVLGYTGTDTNEFVQTAPEGKEYYLIKMTITKKDSTENIEWDKMTLTDSAGNVYKRCEDAFIADLGMKRIPGTALNFGTYEGWIAYEVNTGASGLTLQYDFTAEPLKYSFPDT